MRIQSSSRPLAGLALIATIFIAICAISTRAEAQKVYQCGSSISQTPCAGGTERDLKGGRNEAQQAQAAKTTNSVGKTADAMEKSRLAQEKQDAAANRGTVINAQPTPEPASPNAPPVLKKKKRQAPEHFTAQAPGEKKAKAPKKAKAKKPKDSSA